MELDVARRRARQHLGGGLDAVHLLHRVRPERRVTQEELALVGVTGEQHDPVSDEGRRGVVAGEHEQEAEAEDIKMFSEPTGKCDFCGQILDLTSVTVISIDILNTITEKGFVPARMPVPKDLAKVGITREVLWLTTLDSYQGSQWGVCNVCKEEVEGFIG